MAMFISEILGGEVLTQKFSDSPYNAEICDKLYLKYKILPSKFASSPNIAVLE